MTAEQVSEAIMNRQDFTAGFMSGRREGRVYIVYFMDNVTDIFEMN